MKLVTTKELDYGNVAVLAYEGLKIRYHIGYLDRSHYFTSFIPDKEEHLAENILIMGEIGELTKLPDMIGKNLKNRLDSFGNELSLYDYVLVYGTDKDNTRKALPGLVLGDTIYTACGYTATDRFLRVTGMEMTDTIAQKYKSLEKKFKNVLEKEAYYATGNLPEIGTVYIKSNKDYYIYIGDVSYLGKSGKELRRYCYLLVDNSAFDSEVLASTLTDRYPIGTIQQYLEEVLRYGKILSKVRPSCFVGEYCVLELGNEMRELMRKACLARNNRGRARW